MHKEYFGSINVTITHLTPYPTRPDLIPQVLTAETKPTQCERNDVKQRWLTMSVHQVQSHICNKQTCIIRGSGILVSRSTKSMKYQGLIPFFIY